MMVKDLITGVLRHVMTVAGGSLVTQGYFDDATLQAGIGAVLTLVGIVWSIWEKTQRSRVVTLDGKEVRKAEAVVPAMSDALKSEQKS
jgi:hypothetical protein